MSHHYEFAEFGEPLDLDDKYRVIAFRHGDRLRFRFERLAMPIIIKRPGKSVDFSSGQEQDKGRPTT